MSQFVKYFFRKKILFFFILFSWLLKELNEVKQGLWCTIRITNDEIRVAVQSWLSVQVELMAYQAQSVRASERNSVVVDSDPTRANYL